MKKKKRRKQTFKLKESVKRFLIYFGVSLLIITYTIIKCSEMIKEYKYHQTQEYKLLTIGYSSKETQSILDNIKEKYIDNIIKEEKPNSFYTSLVTNKYYIKDNYKKYLEYYEYHQTTEANDVISIINTRANETWYTNLKKANTNKNPILLNKYNYIEEDYVPDKLIKINLQTSYANNSANEDVVNAYYEMHTATKEETGINLMVIASYRDYDNQERKYAEYKKVSLEYADTFCERAGHSEHQLGIALDLVSTKNYYKNKFIESEEYKWLLDNAYKYGFIVRYPTDKYKITGYDEPNHFTYVGTTISKVIHENKITLDEYYAFYIAK